MTKQTSKQIKIYGLHRSSDNKEVPQLKISGVWLEQLGFKMGVTVNITTRDRLLIIEPAEVQESRLDQEVVLKGVNKTRKSL